MTSEGTQTQAPAFRIPILVLGLWLCSVQVSDSAALKLLSSPAKRREAAHDASGRQTSREALPGAILP